MSQQKLFRISFAYSGSNEETGKLTKEKKDILVSAINYTDAEYIAWHIIPELQQYSDEVEYEIRKINKALLLALNPSISLDKTLKNGLFRYYMEQSKDQAALFKITVEIEEPREVGKPKKIKEDWWVPAETSKMAYDIAHQMLGRIETRSYNIKNITFDMADEIFVTEQEHKKLLYQSESANLL